MEEYKADFLGFAIESGALKFGEFTLKSGRVSPYFFNTGAFSSGAALAKLARAYSICINDRSLEFDMLFGPAYKGIPLVSAISVCYSDLYNRDIGFCFNRKEEKKHGEKGMIVGQDLKGNVLIIDDVISAGTSVRESVKIIEGERAWSAFRDSSALIEACFSFRMVSRDLAASSSPITTPLRLIFTDAP